MDPADTDPVAGLVSGTAGPQRGDPADHLVTGHDGQPGRCGTAFDLVELRVTDPAGGHREQHLTVTGDRVG